MKKIIIAIAIIIAAGLLYYFFMQPKPAPSAAVPAVEEVAPAAVNKMVPESVDAASNNAMTSLISEAAPGADVFILEPGDGKVVTSPVTIKFGITNMTVAKAGDDTPFSGHHHLLINLEELPPLDAPLPATDQIIHFGGAQTETTLDLEPGEYTLQLLLGNYLHIPHAEPVMSKKITITVE